MGRALRPLAASSRWHERGIAPVFVAFSLLGEMALDSSTDRILQERLVTARTAASHFDLLVDRHLSSLAQIHQQADFNLLLTDPAAVNQALFWPIARQVGAGTAFFGGMPLANCKGPILLLF